MTRDDQTHDRTLPRKEAYSASRWALLVHGGAGFVPRENEQAHALGCLRAAREASKILARNGSSLDAVEAAVRLLEDNPLFNAGTGAALNEHGDVALDASIMCGATLRAGAVAVLPPFANPISIARAILEENRHVMYAGEGAVRTAERLGFQASTQDAMRTDRARAQWQRARDSEGKAGGTVGAVAVDLAGHCAAATSTGGTANKKLGRVGDAPVIGAGTFADDMLGAVSSTGHGEAFLRMVFAARMAMQMHDDPAGTADKLLRDMQRITEGTGGVIALTRDGRAVWAHSSPTMSWALVRATESSENLDEFFGI